RTMKALPLSSSARAAGAKPRATSAAQTTKPIRVLMKAVLSTGGSPERTMRVVAEREQRQARAPSWRILIHCDRPGRPVKLNTPLLMLIEAPFFDKGNFLQIGQTGENERRPTIQT